MELRHFVSFACASGFYDRLADNKAQLQNSRFGLRMLAGAASLRTHDAANRRDPIEGVVLRKHLVKLL